MKSPVSSRPRGNRPMTLQRDVNDRGVRAPSKPRRTSGRRSTVALQAFRLRRRSNRSLPKAPPLPKRSAALRPDRFSPTATRLDGVLGEGGMGIVYRCLDTYSGDEVALKRVIIPEGPLANEYVLWFYKESKALATLDHPSIVRARDFGQLNDGSPFLVMDLVVGVSLHDLSHARMSFPLIWCVVDQILGRTGTRARTRNHPRGLEAFERSRRRAARGPPSSPYSRFRTRVAEARSTRRTPRRFEGA